MLEYHKIEEKEINIENLQPGDVFLTAMKKFAFVRIKKGLKNMVATRLDSGSNYDIKIEHIKTKKVIGKLKKDILK